MGHADAQGNGGEGAERRSGWVTIDQAAIDRFADATGDRQFIHVDPAAAAATPFGGTVAHGFLLLSLLPRLMADAIGAGGGVAINYGCDRVRFVTPVRAGARVRARFAETAHEPRAGGGTRRVFAVAIELEGSPQPAMVADWIVLTFDRTD